MDERERNAQRRRQGVATAKDTCLGLLLCFTTAILHERRKAAKRHATSTTSHTEPLNDLPLASMHVSLHTFFSLKITRALLEKPCAPPHGCDMIHPNPITPLQVRLLRPALPYRHDCSCHN